MIMMLVFFLVRVVHIDEDSAIEYDCTENFLTHDYCIHIMSRTPTMSEEKLQQLLQFAGNLLKFVTCLFLICQERLRQLVNAKFLLFLEDELELNVDHLDYKTSDQTGCWQQQERRSFCLHLTKICTIFRQNFICQHIHYLSNRYPLG